MRDTTTLFDGANDKQMFAEVIIDIIKMQHKEGIQLENIPLGIKRLEDLDLFESTIGIPRLQEIAKIQGKPGEDWKVTVQRMLGLFCHIGEIKKYSEGIYRLSKDGRIYKHLAEN